MRQQIPKIDENRQRGAALAVSLILLLVMTLIGVATMNRARLELAMSGLMQQEEEALRRAERGLLQAEAFIEQLAANAGPHGFNGTGEYSVSDELDARHESWDFSHKTITGDDDETGDAYVIQYMGPMVVPGETMAEETGAVIPGGLIFVTRTFVRAESRGKSTRIVESLYSTIAVP